MTNKAIEKNRALKCEHSNNKQVGCVSNRKINFFGSGFQHTSLLASINGKIHDVIQYIVKSKCCN